jgi:hypothetical protein
MYILDFLFLYLGLEVPALERVGDVRGVVCLGISNTFRGSGDSLKQY